MTGILTRPTGLIKPTVGAASFAAQMAAVAWDGWWRLGEASGTTAVDASGNGRDGTYVNSPTLGSTGLVTGDANTCITMDGTNDRVDIPDAAPWDSTTPSLFAIIDDVVSASTLMVICRDASSPRSFQFRLNAGKVELVLVVGASSAVATGATSVNDGNKHTIGGTFDGTTIKVYVDGALDGSQASALSLAASTEPLRLGARRSSSAPAFANFYAGKLDEAAFKAGVVDATTYAALHAAA